MIIVLYALSFVMVVAGLGAIVTGSELIVLERGWSSVIAGSILATGGFIVFALALVLRELRNLPDRLETAQYDYETAPIEPQFPEPPPSVVTAQTAGAQAMNPPIPAVPPLLTPAAAAAPLVDSFAEELKSRLSAERAGLRQSQGLAPEPQEPPKPLFGREPGADLGAADLGAADLGGAADSDARWKRPEPPAGLGDAGRPGGLDWKPTEPAKEPDLVKGPAAVPFPSATPSWLRPAVGEHPKEPVKEATDGPAVAPAPRWGDALPRGPEAPAAVPGHEPPPVVKPADRLPAEAKAPEVKPPEARASETKPPETKPPEPSPLDVKPPETGLIEPGLAGAESPAAGQTPEPPSPEVVVPGARTWAEKASEEKASEPKVPEVTAPEAEPEQEEAPAAEEAPTVVGSYSSGSNVYVMYSDGAIEADTPDGVFRFASLDELKAFIASGEAPPVREAKPGAVG